ncbi:GATOR complex protein WDR59-like isoform X2 [Physella acuta]|uniref:GATOR complex protein WDR59-like isoform X2 n=1 Tax=Physella acuta TaxID=109671 RepID=UPI0027DAFD57|nr:GATOR complex protein WDR59-like isoform X2 [Physella acuta]
MAGRWSTELAVTEFKDIQASAMAVDCIGQWALLAGRKNLAFVDLTKTPHTSVKVTRQSKWDISCVQWNGHASHAYRFVTACNQRLDVFDFRDGSASHCCSLKAHSRNISDVDWSPFDVNIVASCSVDTYTYFWDVRDSKKPVKSFQSVCAYQVKWNKVTNNLFATTHDGDVRIWDPRKGNAPLQYISAHPSKIHGLDWSNTDQHKLTTASQDCSIRVWDYNNPRKCEAMINSENPVWRARYTPFGEGIVSVVVPQLRRGDNNLYLWHIRNQSAPVHTFVGHKDVILEFQWKKQQTGARDQQLVTWSKDQSLRIWKVDPTMQKSCGYEIDDQTNGLLEDDELTSFGNYKSQLDEKHVSMPHQETIDLSSHSTTAGDKSNSSLPGGGQSLMSTMLSALPLDQEVEEIKGRIPGFKIEQADFLRRMLTFRLTKGLHYLDIQLTFPDRYPIKIIPNIVISQTNLDQEISNGIYKAFNETCTKFVSSHLNCLEPAIKTMLQHMEKTVSTPMSPETPVQQLEDRKSLLDKKFHVEKVIRPPVSPVAQNVVPIYPTGSFQDSCIPFPRTSGATFCSNDRLVTFGIPASMKKVNDDSELTPRAISDLVSYTMSSQWMRPQSNSFVSSLFYSSPPAITAEGISVSNFYTEKYYRGRHHRPGHHKARARDTKESKQDKADKMNKKMQKVGSVKVYDVSSIIPISKFLAQNYKLDLDDIHGTCEHNSNVAKKLGRKDLVMVWEQVDQMTKPCLQPSLDISKGMPWAYTPFGRQILKKMLDHYNKIKDVQTMAMLCCVFWDKEKPRKDLSALMASSSSQKTSEYIAPNTRKHSLQERSSLADSLRENYYVPEPEKWCSIPEVPEITMASSTDSGWNMLLNKTGSNAAVQIYHSPFPSLPPPPSSSPSSSLIASSVSVVRGRGRTMAEVASQPNLAALFRAGRGKASRSAAMIKSKRSFSWSESYDEFKIVEDKDPKDRVLEKEISQHRNNSKMLAPELRQHYEHIKKTYANILFKWGLLNERALILKHTNSIDAEQKVIEFPVSCWNCHEDVKGAQCTHCSYTALRCAVCNLGVRAFVQPRTNYKAADVLFLELSLLEEWLSPANEPHLPEGSNSRLFSLATMSFTDSTTPTPLEVSDSTCIDQYQKHKPNKQHQ